MDISEIKELIELINNSDLAYFEYKDKNSNIKMDKSLTREVNNLNKQDNNKKINTGDKVLEKNILEKKLSDEVKEDKTNNLKENINEKEEISGSIVTSPMVGTFYGSPSPDSESFVKVGDPVKKGDVLCIIEAMKLMNEIESEFSGTVAEILVKDGDMVEYGTPLFKIKEGI
ncbi:acetyl-CoA carboxylase biotin carboxyl carrier protein [Clostridium moniliforme]|uniref:Biotin carboxyl carrier protein of acetyl-CoA carboxylase n=1 Tax=Clostridium moniliforme TaxID=39489 RepID=A0ABS4EXB3_9CLOT|nr:acetyl-CoA carboxylase biotin carboxyl carrier protein [Clostridium moniliforme]MBP1888639.1 acetyl-CoA carboxylase biotin carboxyl carrier protein [Clostridium moniliforme]